MEATIQTNLQASRLKLGRITWYSPDVEANGNNEGQCAIGRIARRLGHRLRAREHAERFLIEDRRPRTLHDTAAQQVPFMVDGEGDLRDTLLAACSRRRRVTLEAFEMGRESALPSDQTGWGMDRGARRRWCGGRGRHLDRWRRGRLALFDGRFGLGRLRRRQC